MRERGKRRATTGAIDSSLALTSARVRRRRMTFGRVIVSPLLKPNDGGKLTPAKERFSGFFPRKSLQQAGVNGQKARGPRGFQRRREREKSPRPPPRREG